VRRLPVAAFVALVIATVGAFFVTQHLKVSTPLIAGYPAPAPATFNPVSGRTCVRKNNLGVRVPVNFKRMHISFYLLHRADDVDVDVVGEDGVKTVDVLATGRHMKIKTRGYFTWDGRESNGRFAPDGTYYIRVSLLHQGRTLLISNSSGNEPVRIERHAPALRVTGVAPAVIPQAGVAAVTASFTGAVGQRPRVNVYRTDLPGGPVLVKSFNATSRHGRTLWNGTLQRGRPAPQGTYLIGLRLTDAACNVARFPTELPPTPGSTTHAGVTVRYLAAQPPMTAVPAGARATVDVDARQHRYFWALRRAAQQRVLGSGASSAVQLAVRLPAAGPGMYELALRYGAHRTVVPLIASGLTKPHAAVLVVLPSLTWQGDNPVDDDGDGIPNTLLDGQPIRLARPLADGLPAGFADEAALIARLRSAGLAFDLTTDLGLLEGIGPQLSGRHGVVLAGTERWLPATLGAALSTFVQRGGHVLSLGIGSLRRSVTVSGGQAMDPGSPHATDFLLARLGPVTSSRGALILVDHDGLHIFSGTSGALRGYRSYQPIDSVVAPATIASAAGVSNASHAVVGYRLGQGSVVDIGLPGFGLSLRHNVDAQELLASVWKLLGR
jgi:hypothetical protein